MVKRKQQPIGQEGEDLSRVVRELERRIRLLEQELAQERND